MSYYRLDGHTPVRCTLLEWAEFCETEYVARTVDITTVAGRGEVRTLFHGHDPYAAPDAPAPRLFGTLVLRNGQGWQEYLYATWDEAAASHARFVAALKQ